MYISLYVVVNTFIGGRQPQNKLMRLKTFKKYNQYVETDNTTAGGKKYNMDTKDTAEKTAPSVAPAKPAPVPKPAGEPRAQEPVPSVPFSGLVDDSPDGLGAAFSGLSGGPSEGKKKAKEKEAVDMGAEGVGPGHDPTDKVPLEDTPSKSAPSASEHPAAPSPTTNTLLASHPATSSPTTTPPMAEGVGFTAVPYPTNGVDSFAAAPPMATAVSEPVASSSTYTGIRESMPRRYADDYHRPATGVYMTRMAGYAPPETGYTMPAPGFTPETSP